ncbi:hypothetical protein ACFQBQ_03065 [Granulicella cerasi]|uniref:Shikimate dehydrogenase n=1 Tax=Granulicella cerasi TaxID=741063 RepID=A0ABW1Z864_9BACT|nr:hypothetical protein [Granulicella cerasi]
MILHDVDTAKAEKLAQLLGHRGQVASGPPDPAGCDLVINTTPMGMHPDDPLPVSGELLTASMFVGDVVAGHGQTPLLKAAQAASCKPADGSGMVDAGLDLMLEFLLGKR